MTINRGARVYYGETKGGVKAALIVRRADQIYRKKHSSINDANKAGELGWPIDANTLWYARTIAKATVIMTLNMGTGDLWISRLEDWTDKEKLIGSDMIKTDKRGHAIYHLSVEHMKKIDGGFDLKVSKR